MCSSNVSFGIHLEEKEYVGRGVIKIKVVKPIPKAASTSYLNKLEDGDPLQSSLPTSHHDTLRGRASPLPRTPRKYLHDYTNSYHGDADSGIGHLSSSFRARSPVTFTASPVRASHSIDTYGSRSHGLDTTNTRSNGHNTYATRSNGLDSNGLRSNGIELSRSRSNTSLDSYYQSPTQDDSPEQYRSYSDRFQSPVRDHDLYNDVDKTDKYTTPTKGDSDRYRSPSRGDPSERYQSPSKDRLYSKPPRPISADVFRSSTCSPESPRTPTRVGSADIFQIPTKTINDERKVQDLKMTLDDSESRRLLLVQRLRDAQELIQLQSKRIKDAESESKDTKFEVNDLKYREEEYRKTIKGLESGREEVNSMRLDHLRHREDMQHRLETLEQQLRMAQTQYNLLKVEGQKKQELVDSVTQSAALVEEENTKMAKVKESMEKEVSAMKESLDITRARNEWLETHSKDHRGEIDHLRNENHTISRENRSMTGKVAELKASNQQLREENAALIATIQSLKEERQRLMKEIDQLKERLSDIRATLATTSAEKERYLQEKMELHGRITSLSHEREHLMLNKTSLEEQVGELNAEVARVTLNADRAKDERKKLEEELIAVKKVSEVLSAELSSTRVRLEKVTDQSTSLEQTKKLAFQQHSIYEQEIQSLEKQIDTLKKSLENNRKERIKDKESLDENTLKLKEELRQVKGDKHHLEMKVHDVETKLKQTEQSLEDRSQLQTKETETWRNQCDNLGATVTRKDAEIEQLMNKVHDLEEQASVLQVNHASFQHQHEELLEAREELIRGRDENRRLLQERAENQQVIQLLEMQKNILSKTAEGNLDKAQNKEQLQAKIDDLETDNTQLQSKLKDLEKVRDSLIKEKEERLASGDLFLGKMEQDSELTAQLEELTIKLQDAEHQRKKLADTNAQITQKMHKVEQENKQFKEDTEETVPKIEFAKLAVEKKNVEEDLDHQRALLSDLEHQYSILQSEIQQKNDNDDKEKDEEFSSLEKEKSSLESQVALLNSQMVLMENGKKRAEDHAMRLEAQLEDFMQRHNDASSSQAVQQDKLTQQVKGMKKDLEMAKAVNLKQETLIHTLREQSLDEVGGELTHMRTELQKLMEVIQVKDQAIEDLEQQLKVSRQQIINKERTIQDLHIQISDSEHNSETSNGGIVSEKVQYLEEEKGSLSETLQEVEKERDDFCLQVSKLTKERDIALQDSNDLQQGLDDMQQMHDEEKQKLLEKMHKELRAKDRQIESLEEQLRGATSSKIKKLKRDAGRVELLRSQNRVLQNSLNLAQSNKLVPHWASCHTLEEQNSWDSEGENEDLDSPPSPPLYSYNNNFSDNNQIDDYSDVENAVALLGNVEDLESTLQIHDMPKIRMNDTQDSYNSERSHERSEQSGIIIKKNRNGKDEIQINDNGEEKMVEVTSAWSCDSENQSKFKSQIEAEESEGRNEAEEKEIDEKLVENRNRFDFESESDEFGNSEVEKDDESFDLDLIDATSSPKRPDHTTRALKLAETGYAELKMDANQSLIFSEEDSSDDPIVFDI